VASLDSRQPVEPGKTEGWQSLPRGGNAPRALIITGGVALHAVSIYVVATIMPVVVGDIGGLAFFAWTATLYLAGALCSASAVPLLLSRWGPRTAYRIGFGVFLSGSLVCSLAPSMAVMLVGRLLQGLGGGMLPALAYAIIRQIFPAALHARAIALVGSVWGVAALVGPSIGGLFAELGAWRAAFWIDIVIGLGLIAASERALPRAVGGIDRRPFPGLRLGLLVTAAVSVGCGGAAARPPAAILGTGGAIALFSLMLYVDAASRPRLLPGGAFNPRQPLGAVSATMGLLILASSPCTFIPYILRAGHGVAPVIGGYVNAAYALSWTVASLLTASAAAAGARKTIGAGPFFMLAGLALLAWAVPAGAVPMVIAGQMLMGAGIGMGWAHLGALLMAVAPPGERNVVGPFLTTAQTLAAAFGSAFAGMVANLAGLADATSPAAAAAAGAWLFGVSTIVPLAGCLAAWRALALTRA
jgi:MFS family permease